jgi:hypothetical protein
MARFEAAAGWTVGRLVTWTFMRWLRQVGTSVPRVADHDLACGGS